MIPYLVYYKKLNPEYGKEYTLDDIQKPTPDHYETYQHMISNWLTLGRSIPEYDVWVENYRKMDLDCKIMSASCKFMIGKQAVQSEQEELDFFKEHPEYEELP